MYKEGEGAFAADSQTKETEQPNEAYGPCLGPDSNKHYKNTFLMQSLIFYAIRKI